MSKEKDSKTSKKESGSKTLLLMRHAKSSWKHTELADHERPLNKRGEKDAPRMGKFIKEKKLLPDIILCSSAVRARSTAEAMIDKSGFKGEVRYLDSLYLAEPDAYLAELAMLPEGIKKVMVIGHNPGLEGLLQILCKKVESLPTAALADLKIPIENWSEIKNNVEGKLVDLWRPRELK